jgi:GWxTD domain-containing protein
MISVKYMLDNITLFHRCDCLSKSAGYKHDDPTIMCVITKKGGNIMANKLPAAVISVLLLFIVPSVVSAEEKSKLPDKYKKWIEEEVVYIITPAEKEVFYKLETDKERERFIEEFWQQRDPTSGTPKNEFKEEHFRRIEYVNTAKMWGQTRSKGRWRTDRGRIYITLGKPQLIEHYSASEIFPAEIWYYQGNPRYGQPPLYCLLFFKRHGGGNFVLYNPISDGPRSLTPLVNVGSIDDQDRQAYNLIKNRVSVSLASASVSSFPGQGFELQSGWALRLPSTILISEVHTFPYRKVKDDYAYEFLEHEPSVEVNYSVYYIRNWSRVDVIQDPSGLFFVDYAVEPETLSMNLFDEKYLSNLKVSVRVTDPEDRTIFQQEKNFPIEMREERYKNIKERPFQLYDSFPLISGNYRFNILLENTVSKEFTSLEKDISVPESGSFQMSSLVLAEKVNKESPCGQSVKTFKIGNLQIYPSVRKIFSNQENLYLFFQVYDLSPILLEKGTLEFAFYRGEEQFQTIRKKIDEYEDKRNFLEEISLKKFPPGNYTLKVSLFDEGGKEVLSNREDLSISDEPLPEPWILGQTNPPSNDPLYPFMLGSQFLSKGEILKGCEELEKAYSGDRDSIHYALNYARALLELRDYERMRDILIPFLDKPDKKFILYRFLGIAHQGMEEYEKAISFYKQYISHEGASFEILNSIALCYYQSGDDKQALTAWEKSLEINPKQEELKEVIQILKERIRKKK